MMSTLTIDAGLDIQLTQEVQVLPQESKGCIKFHLNGSMVLVPMEKTRVELLYQLTGLYGPLGVGLWMPTIVFHVELQTDG